MNNTRLRNAKVVIVLLGAECACLAVGLAVQHRYIEASVLAQVEKGAFHTLLESWGSYLPDLAKLSPETKNAAAEAVPLVLANRNISTGKLILLDAHRQVLYGSPGDVPDSDNLSLEFIPRASIQTDSRGLLEGSLQRGEANQPAIACRRADGGYAIAYMPVEQLVSQTRAILESMPAIGALTWLWTMALLGIASHLIVSKIQEQSARAQAKAESDGLRQRQHLLRTRDAVIFGLAKLAESRDPDTGDHLDRISVYSTTFAQFLSRCPAYRDEATPAFVRNIGISSVLHDIGKVGIEDRILLKPGHLTSNERSDMETHCRIAGDCLREIEQRLGHSNFLETARQIALCHHERWDGSGYPSGLRGEQIPLSARIVAIADVYDALSSRRVYKPPKPHEECVAIIRAGAGTHFDPTLVELWLTLADRFAEIARRYPDHEPQAEETPTAVKRAARQQARDAREEKEESEASIGT